MKQTIITHLRESAELKLRLAKESADVVEDIANLVIKALKSRGKILLFGNGGSAADAQHIAAEFINRFQRERRALPAIALTTDTSIITSIGNDSSFSHIFSRQIEALGKKGDIAWAISTSGKSRNVISALKTARELGLHTIGFTGQTGDKMKDLMDLAIQVPSRSTPRIQEVHITVAHIICELAEEAFSSAEGSLKR
ncbi:MAG: D-sedoheptulose 7-phosphate isomerase [Candidatus Dadabacteria bacterium]|nr:D-sedoheptulose 7-phosphate isomerase [Candidatus Dadabacteria bacterium]